MTEDVWPYLTPGIEDEKFIQGNVPMTKQEVRAVILSKAKIKKHHVIYDIGAGTGSISVEAAVLAKEGRVYAVEQEEEALELLHKNKESFQLDNLIIIKGSAPNALETLPPAHRVIIGGSGGKLEEILNICALKMKERGVLTCVAVTMDTLTGAQEYLEKTPWRNLNIVQISVNRAVKAGRFKIFKALNPVFILTSERRNT